MLRIHFTSQDLAKTRIAAAPDPMWELSLSMHQLRLGRESNPLLTTWRSTVSRLLYPGGVLRREVALPLALNPPRGYFPDFLTPFEGSDGFEAGLQAVMATSKTQLRREIDLFGTHPALAPMIAGIGRGEVAMLRELIRSMRRYHEIALNPVWDMVTAAVEADRIRRARHLVDGGWAAVLGSLHPCARFDNGIMEIAVWGLDGDQDLHLDGRGLLLVPSYFKESRQLLLLADVDLPPVLVYPIDPYIRASTDATHAPLSALIGRTRATVLQMTATGGTTSEIALWIRISAPAASKHLSVLRKAGLVNSTRDQNTVFHTLTLLGRALLAAG